MRNERCHIDEDPYHLMLIFDFFHLSGVRTYSLFVIYGRRHIWSGRILFLSYLVDCAFITALHSVLSLFGCADSNHDPL